MALLNSLYFIPSIQKCLMKFEPGTPTPVITYFPFDVNTPTGFRAAVFLELTFFILMNLKMVVLDYFVMAIIILHVSQMRFLNDVLRIILRDASYTYKRKSLKLWVEQHQESYRAVLSLKPLIAGYLAVVYVHAVVHTCIPAFVITSTRSWTIPQKVSLFTLISGVILSLYLLSEAGDTLTTATQKIGDTLYGTHLIEWKSSNRVFTFYGQLKPFYFTVASLFPLCFPTFIAIIKAIGTYYMALNEVQRIRNG